ncbi:hypothetical protein CHLRE_12g539181v5 [Chlamydomonas reinhardtii]|uniref:Uncharacterized protein n=1 Tax=Chlamydomonas reinhardtii TaxID=3055 RepID=A0A2K3D5D0_CHLRE|nr:uncharacterized protein CHLRE_12g539181v5 [Chlamydomonas reinhardtii]PNW75743.1 hypothetical protein CHLRE_12g539181v5 [Chlamydomonas reinhardtii]
MGTPQPLGPLLGVQECTYGLSLKCSWQPGGGPARPSYPCQERPPGGGLIPPAPQEGSPKNLLRFLP